MLAYIQYILFTSILVIWTKYNIRHNKSKECKVYWFIEWFVFTFIAAFRLVDGKVGGADSEHYVESFLTGTRLSSEPLLYLIGDLVHYLTNNYHIYFFVIYGIIVFGLLFFAGNVFNEKTNFIILYFYFVIYCTAFGVMRQWLAVSVGLISFVYFKKNKLKKAIVFSILATGFHFTIIIYLSSIILYIVLKLDKRLLKGRILIISSIVINLVFLAETSLFINFVANTEYLNYVTPKALSDVSYLGYLPTIAFLIICMLFYTDVVKQDIQDKKGIIFLWINLSLTYAMISLGMFRIMVIFWPIRAYMTDRISIVMSKRIVWGDSKGMVTRYIFLVMIFVDCVLYMWRGIGNNCLPYYCSWMY